MSYVKINLKKIDIFRPAEPSDIIEGNIVFLIGDGDILYKMTIDEVIAPSSLYSAFYGNDGCSYGLDDLYVLKTNSDLYIEINKLKSIIDDINETLTKYL